MVDDAKELFEIERRGLRRNGTTDNNLVLGLVSEREIEENAKSIEGGNEEEMQRETRE